MPEGSVPVSSPRTHDLAVGLLHLAPVLGDVAHNQALLIRATRQAAALGARWVVSGELVVTGYGFEPVLGCDWVAEASGAFLQEYARLCGDLRITGFISHPEHDATTGLLHNTLFVFGSDGRLIGQHRKMRPIPISEAWSAPSDEVTVLDVDGVHVGLLVCADAYPVEPARRMRDEGAELLVSAACWGPGEWGPSGEWEARSRECGIPMLVANRTGQEPGGDMSGAVSVVVNPDGRVAAVAAVRSTIFLVRGSLRGGFLRSCEVLPSAVEEGAGVR